MVRIVPFIERRQHRRQGAAGTAVAVSAEPADHAAVSRLSLRDVSSGGLSAVSRIGFHLASPVTVLLPRRLAGGIARLLAGRVVRCQPIESGYRVAVAFDRPPTVAG